MDNNDRFDEEVARICETISPLDKAEFSAALLRAAVRMAKEDRDRETMEGRAAVEHVAVMEGASDYTDAEVERMARAGCRANFCEDSCWSGPLAGKYAMEAARQAIVSTASNETDRFITAVLAEKAKIDAEKMPPASEPAPRVTPRCACRHAPNHVGPLAEEHGCPCGPSCPCIADVTPAAPTGTARDLKASILALVRSLASRPGADGATLDKVTSVIATDTALGRLFDGFPFTAPPPLPAEPVHVTIDADQLDELAEDGEASGETHDRRRIVIHLAPSAVEWMRTNVAAAPPPAEHGGGEAPCSHPIERVLPGARGWCIDCGSLFFAGAWESPLLASPAPAVPANGAEGGEVAEVLADARIIVDTINVAERATVEQDSAGQCVIPMLNARRVIRELSRHVERLAREVAGWEEMATNARGAWAMADKEAATLRARVAELTDEVAINSNLLTSTIRIKDEHAAERDTLRATIADLERRLAVEKASWQRVYDLDVGRLKARVAELEARAEEARNDIIAELIDGVAEIGCIYGGDVKEPQITGREEVVAGLEKLREILGGGR